MTIHICFENRTRKHARYILVVFLAQQTTLFNVGSKGKLQIRRAPLSATEVDEKWYPAKDYHDIYIGTIVEAYQNC